MEPQVREEMVAAGMAIVDVHGAAHSASMMPLFESFLDDSKRPGAQKAAVQKEVAAPKAGMWGGKVSLGLKHTMGG